MASKGLYEAIWKAFESSKALRAHLFPAHGGIPGAFRRLLHGVGALLRAPRERARPRRTAKTEKTPGLKPKGPKKC